MREHSGGHLVAERGCLELLSPPSFLSLVFFPSLRGGTSDRRFSVANEGTFILSLRTASGCLAASKGCAVSHT